MQTSRDQLTRADVIAMVAENMYSGKVINNAHRGDIVEMMVLAALDGDWRPVGLGWHPWDLQRGEGSERVRIQVKQCAALQLWGPTRKLKLIFGWKKKPPEYFHKDNPGEEIESEGWFCDLFVFGLHLEKDEDRTDQVEPTQWSFLVVPTSDLKRGQNSMGLTKALKKWQPVTWNELPDTVDLVVQEMRQGAGIGPGSIW